MEPITLHIKANLSKFEIPRTDYFNMRAVYRNVLSKSEESLRVFLLAEREFPAAWHFHPQYELTYIISSSGMRYVGDSVHNFSEGDFVLVGTNLPHSWKTVGRQTAHVKAVVIQWNEDFLGEGWSQRIEFQNIHKLLKLSTRGVKFSPFTSHQMAERICALPDLSPFERFVHLLKLLDDLSRQTDYLLLSSANFNANITTEDSNRISIIQTYVKNHVHEKISVSEVAEQIGLTKVSFCRYFKKVHNKTFVTFLNEFRIALACKLLIETDKTASEIGYHCGFKSISLFHQLFNQFMKTTPLAYRKKYLSIPASS